jgi:hypothetical protein
MARLVRNENERRAAAGRKRLDEAHWCKKDLIGRIKALVPLSYVADLVAEGRVPPEQDIYKFASVSRVEARVRPKGETSGIDLVHGSVGVVGADCSGMVVSKEYFILRPKEGCDAHWLAALLRTRARGLSL